MAACNTGQTRQARRTVPGVASTENQPGAGTLSGRLIAGTSAHESSCSERRPCRSSPTMREGGIAGNMQTSGSWASRSSSGKELDHPLPSAPAHPIPHRESRHRRRHAMKPRSGISTSRFRATPSDRQSGIQRPATGLSSFGPVLSSSFCRSLASAGKRPPRGFLREKRSREEMTPRSTLDPLARRKARREQDGFQITDHLWPFPRLGWKYST